MKPSGGEERLRPGQNDLDRLGLGTGANVPPKSYNAYRRKAPI